MFSSAMKKIKAASIHFAISLLLFGFVLGLFVLHWYPLPYFWADGAWEGISIAAGVDLVLGPLLTLVVYKQGKKSLKLDLSVIALLQLSALLWGLHNIYQMRPIYLVFGNIAGQGELHTVTLNQIADKISPLALTALVKNNPFNPPLVFADLPSDTKSLWKTMLNSPYHVQANRLQPYSETQMNKLLQHGLPRNYFDQIEPEKKREFEHFLAKNNAQFEDYAFVPLHCRYASLILIYDRKQRKEAGYLYSNDTKHDNTTRQ